MKLYKNNKGEVYAFELDGSQDHLIKPDMIPVSKEDVQAAANLLITWKDIKYKRDLLLKDCDWADLPNSPVKNKPAWLRYRQELRELPQKFNTPQEVVWPIKPA
jgi:hypothetical protein